MATKEESKLTQMLLTTMVTSQNMKWSFMAGDGDRHRWDFRNIVAFHWLLLMLWVIALLFFVTRRRKGQSYQIKLVRRAKEMMKDHRNEAEQFQHNHNDYETESVSDFESDHESHASFLPLSPARSNSSAHDESHTIIGEESELQESVKIAAVMDEVVVEEQVSTSADSNIELPSLEEDVDDSHNQIIERSLDAPPMLRKLPEAPNASDMEEKVVIFHGWLSKQSREHWYLWQKRYFEIYSDGNVAYYPRGVAPGDERYGVKLYQKVKWSKMVGGKKKKMNKLELTSPNKCILGKVKVSKKMDNGSTVEDWLVKGNSWM